MMQRPLFQAVQVGARGLGLPVAGPAVVRPLAALAGSTVQPLPDRLGCPNCVGSTAPLATPSRSLARFAGKKSGKAQAKGGGRVLTKHARKEPAPADGDIMDDAESPGDDKHWDGQHPENFPGGEQPPESSEAVDAKVRKLLEDTAESVPFLLPEDAVKLHETRGCTFIDVREPPEWADTGMVAEALPVPRGVLEFVVGDRVPTDEMIVMYCSNGYRAALAAQTMLDLGYTDVINAGGYQMLADTGIETEPFAPGPPPGFEMDAQ